jgi:hypothetical protein
MRLAQTAALACALALVSCGGEEPAARDLPSEWYTASEDPRAGGRFLPDRRAELLRLQAEVWASPEPFLYPHFADSRTVVFAIKQDFIASGTRRRLALVLEHEADDPELSILALADQPADSIRKSLDLGPAAARIAFVGDATDAPSGASFQFVRDYAPLVRARRVAGAFETASLVLFEGSTLNKVVDARLGVRTQRSPAVMARRRILTRRLADAYRARLDASVALETTPLRLDGGNIVTDGAGTCFSTPVLVAKNGGDGAFVDGALRKLGCRRSVKLLAPQHLDFIQHVDTLLYFASSTDVVLSMPQRYEDDKVAEFQNVRTLLALGYTVHRVPRRTASITYTNILTTRSRVYVPQYTRYQIETPLQQQRGQALAKLRKQGQREQAAALARLPIDVETVAGGERLERENRHAVEVLAALFPSKRVVPVDSDETLTTRGSWHCLSHELPERL